jgi:hypothetical protein
MPDLVPIRIALVSVSDQTGLAGLARGLVDLGVNLIAGTSTARHLAEHILPGELVTILRLCRRVLAPGSPVVFVTPNPATLTVGAHTFWTDPGHLRPIPPEAGEIPQPDDPNS